MLKTALIRVALAALVAVIGVTALTVLVFWVLVLGQIWPSANHQISPGLPAPPPLSKTGPHP